MALGMTDYPDSSGETTYTADKGYDNKDKGYDNKDKRYDNTEKGYGLSDKGYGDGYGGSFEEKTTAERERDAPGGYIHSHLAAPPSAAASLPPHTHNNTPSYPNTPSYNNTPRGYTGAHPHLSHPQYTHPHPHLVSSGSMSATPGGYIDPANPAVNPTPYQRIAALVSGG